MDFISEFYSDKVDEIFYLELKNNDKGIDYPLPILKKDFVEEIKAGTFNERIEFKYFLRGIVYNLAIDNNFKYREEYFKLLKDIMDNLDKIVMNMAFEEMEDDIVTSNIFLKFNYNEFGNYISNYYYAVTLIEIFKDKKEEEFLLEAERVLNRNIVINENYPLTYLLLGDIEYYRNNLIKANYYYLHARDNIEELKNYDVVLNEINNKILEIQTEVLLIESKELLAKGKYYDLIERLENYELDDYRKYYYLANSYFALLDYEKAFKNYEKAEGYSNKEVEFFIDYSYFLSQTGYVDLSLSIIEKGLKEYVDNEKLLFNRAVIYINIGENKKAKEDLENIVGYYDISEDIFNNAMILLEQIQD